MQLDQVREESSRLAFALHQNKAALDEAVSENSELREKLEVVQGKLEAEAEHVDEFRCLYTILFIHKLLMCYIIE
jgi:predicted nuclease with TOPRIM domain